LHEKWKIAPYGSCIKILSLQKWPAKQNPSFGAPLVPTPEMMRRQSLSYGGVAKDTPPSEKIVSKVVPPDANELVERIRANRVRREETKRDRLEKKRTKEEQSVKIMERKKAGRGAAYLIELNNEPPKWMARSIIPKRFTALVEQFDDAWDLASKVASTDKKLPVEIEVEHDKKLQNSSEEAQSCDDDILKDIGLSGY